MKNNHDRNRDNIAACIRRWFNLCQCHDEAHIEVPTTPPSNPTARDITSKSQKDRRPRPELGHITHHRQF